MKGGWIVKKAVTAAAIQNNCQLIDHRPALITPILIMITGASQVADISNVTDTVLMTPICVEVNPTDKRYVTICPANERTVRYEQLRAIDGRKSGWRKYSIISVKVEREDIIECD